MSPEREPAPHFVIHEQQVTDIDEATRMRRDSWIDTYTNPSEGVSREWIENYFAEKLSQEGREAREKRFVDAKSSDKFNAWVARDEAGRIIGATTPFIEQDGTQRLGSLYVDKAWHGKGVGAQLMQKALEWLDPSKPVELEVVTYNERAKSFYRKWNFIEIPGSEKKYANMIPEILMIRQSIQENGGKDEV